MYPCTTTPSAAAVIIVVVVVVVVVIIISIIIVVVVIIIIIIIFLANVLILFPIFFRLWHVGLMEGLKEDIPMILELDAQ